jgi:hypothetical protein
MRIFDFALVTEWEARLHDLSVLAEPERWTYVRVPAPVQLPILDSYIRHTFARLSEQDRIQTTSTAACFNTGLLTPSQEQIYGVFNVAQRFDHRQLVGPGNKKWFLKGWARAGDRLLTGFPQLPALPTYWDDPGDLIFNPALQVELNLDHIIRDNLNRFPEELGGKLGRDGVPTEEDLTSEDEDREQQSSIEEVRVPLALRNALEGAMKHSIRLAQRSYRVAVPQFHRGHVQLLLPLYMRDADTVDLALTMEKHGDWYRGATVLYPDWAYRHARLLARPNSEWLGGFRTDLALDASQETPSK